MSDIDTQCEVTRLRAARNARSRGSIYIAVLGASMMVAVIGISATLAVRVHHHGTNLTHEAMQAELHARSAVDLVLLEMAENANWRSDHEHGEWSDRLQLGGSEVRFRLEHPDMSSLSAAPRTHYWLYVQAQHNHALRTYRVLVQQQAAAPEAVLLKNGQARLGTRHWQAGSSSDRLEYTLEDATRGKGSLYLLYRGSSSVAIQQEVTDQIQRGQGYRLSADVRTLSGTRDFQIGLLTYDDAAGYQWQAATLNDIDTQWTTITADVTPNWPGQLQAAQFVVFMPDSNASFLMDNARLEAHHASQRFHPVPGTWQQIVD